MDMNDEYRIPNNYYLLLFLNYYHFSIEDVEEIYVFERNYSLKEFGEMFMNTENFSRFLIISASDVYSKNTSSNFISSKQLTN
jgi:hypothetical protein